MDDTESLRALLDASRGQENWGAGSAGSAGSAGARRPGGPGSAAEGVATADRSSDSQQGAPPPVFGEFVGQGDARVADDELLPFTVGDLGDASPASGHETRRNNAVVLTSVTQAGTREGTREREDHSVHSRLSIKRYRGFFDVDTSDVAGRIGSALAFWRGGDFVDGLNGSPDLYGPFWIASTLVFVSAAAANTAGYIAHQAKKSGDDSSASSSAYWYYDVDKVGGSMALFYGYIGVVGVGMWAAMKYFKASTATASASLATVWCVYGYALTVFVPVSVACVVPSDTARWVLVMTATAVSAAFLLQNVRVCLNMGGSETEGGKAAGGVVLAVAAALHAGLGLALKFVFFDY